MTVLESFKTFFVYPVPAGVILSFLMARGADPEQELSQDVFLSPSYELAKADIMLWLSTAPDVSQGGVSWVLSEQDKAHYRSMAEVIFHKHSEHSPAVTYGYKGTRL